MNLSQYDEELQALRTDIDRIKTYHNHVKRDQRFVIIKYKLAILQLQGALSAILEKLVHATERKAALPPAGRSLVHWGGILSHKVHQVYFSSVQLMGKSMWLNLLRSRVPGSHHGPEDRFSDEHLVELAQRINSMHKTESTLQNELSGLIQQRESLEFRYQDLKTSKQNREASQSFRRSFGHTVKEALSNPVLCAVKTLFWSISRMQLEEQRRASYLTDLHVSVERDANDVMHRCRNIIVESLRNPQKCRSKREVDRYRESLLEIEQLQSQLADASELLLEPPPEARPILLKKSKISGTTHFAR